LTAIGGRVSQSFSTSAFATHALQLPFIGNTSNAVTYVPALNGYWGTPINPTVTAAVGGLAPDDRIDIARPELTGTGGLTWSGQAFIVPSATWTDEGAASRSQFWILLIGAAIGIIGSVPATTILDAIRTRTGQP
jgi:hypothetical protein